MYCLQVSGRTCMASKLLQYYRLPAHFELKLKGHCNTDFVVQVNSVLKIVIIA